MESVDFFFASLLDSSLWFIQPCILHDVLCIQIKLAGWQYTAWMYLSKFWTSPLFHQFSYPVASNSLRPHVLQHARLPCPSLTPGACSNSCPSSWWCHPSISISIVLLSLLPSILTSIRVLSKETVFHISWPKYWCFSFSISPSNKYSELISFRIDWLDLLAVQGNLKSLTQHHSSKPPILWCSAISLVQLSQPYMTTRKTIALSRWMFVSKLMPLLFNTLSRLVKAFLPRSKWPLISWLQSPSAVILEPKKIKYFTVSIVTHLSVMKWWGWMPWSSVFEC